MAQMIGNDTHENSDEIPVSWLISSYEQVESLNTDELYQFREKHELEKVKLKGSVECNADNAHPVWTARSRHVLRILNLHLSWINREIGRRKKNKKIEKQKQLINQKKDNDILEQNRMAVKFKLSSEIKELQRNATIAKMERIKESNDKTRMDILIFKKVVKEFVGEDAYKSLWEITNNQIDQLNQRSNQ